MSTEYFVGTAGEHGVLGRAWPPAMPSASQERPFIKTSSGVIWHDGNIAGTATLAAFALYKTIMTNSASGQKNERNE